MATTTLSIKDQCKTAYAASKRIRSLSTEQKNRILSAMANALVERQDDIIAANQKDIDNGKKANLSPALLDRLLLTPDRIKGMADSIITIKELDDPVGQILESWTQKDGLIISKVRAPLGTIGIIYEARPNVTADAIGLSVKTNNAIVLRGSSSAYQSNKAITHCLKAAAKQEGMAEDAIQLLEDTSRESVKEFVKMKDYLSLVIPRGSAALIQEVVTHATVPSIETGVGNCHIYVDNTANQGQALSIIKNAKTQRPSVCNSCETVLVHQDIAQEFLPKLQDTLSHVELRGCPITQQIINAKPATNEDWDTEYLDLILAVKVVENVDDAIQHIDTHGTHHSEAIISETASNITKFQAEIDAAAVLANASTRFVDGGEFGYGAELGISTQKLHARGPMGLPELTTYKYIITGKGQIRG